MTRANISAIYGRVNALPVCDLQCQCLLSLMKDTHSRALPSMAGFPQKPPGIKVHHKSTVGQEIWRTDYLFIAIRLRGKTPIL